MNDSLKADFYISLINEFKSVNYNMKELPEEKKEPFDFYDIRDLFLIYVNWRKRFIGPGFRKVFYSKELREKLSQNKKLKKIVEKLEYKFKNAEDITPFLTTRVVSKPHVPSLTKDEFEALSSEEREKQMQITPDKDLLLNFFGIQHLHLEENYNNRAKNGIKFTVNSSFQREKTILLAKVEKDTVYFIDINEHDFYDRNILQIMKNNFEHLLKPFESTLENVSKYSDEDTIDMLKLGINVPYDIDDKTYIFSGISTIGTSNSDFFESKGFFQEIEDQYTNIVNKKVLILDEVNKSNHHLTKQTELQIGIVIEKGLLFFVDKISNYTIKNEQSGIYLSEKYCELGFHSYDFNS